MPRRNLELISHKFGRVGNYGAEIAVMVEEESGIVSLNLSNWAYGETSAHAMANGISPEDLMELGQKLIQAAGKLKETL